MYIALLMSVLVNTPFYCAMHGTGDKFFFTRYQGADTMYFYYFLFPEECTAGIKYLHSADVSRAHKRFFSLSLHKAEQKSTVLSQDCMALVEVWLVVMLLSKTRGGYFSSFHEGNATIIPIFVQSKYILWSILVLIKLKASCIGWNLSKCILQLMKILIHATCCVVNAIQNKL